jgi:hypothetical protein
VFLAFFGIKSVFSERNQVLLQRCIGQAFSIIFVGSFRYIWRRGAEEEDEDGNLSGVEAGPFHSANLYSCNSADAHSIRCYVLLNVCV